MSGRTLRQELKKTMKDRRYQELSMEGTISSPSPRVRVLRGIIERYRQRAFEEMLKEFPELRDEVGRRQREQERVRNGLPSEELQQIQNPFRQFVDIR